MEKPLRASEEFIDGPLLISAYDVMHKLISPPYDFGSAIFLDSGGYEIARVGDLSDVGDENRSSRTWSEKEHASVLANWKPSVPSVLISYDHPRKRHTLSEQIRDALKLRTPSKNTLREILIKPETVSQNLIQMNSVLTNIRKLKKFDVIGVTEKEIGNSVLDRMVNIAKLRLALTGLGVNTPIHVFGSLDTVTTLFYFVAGADIFDGLLRYAFKEGHTLYRQDFGISDLGISEKSYKVETQCWLRNYTYMNDMRLQMARFPTTQDFNVFKYHRISLKSAFESVQAELEGYGRRR